MSNFQSPAHQTRRVLEPHLCISSPTPATEYPFSSTPLGRRTDLEGYQTCQQTPPWTQMIPVWITLPLGETIPDACKKEICKQLMQTWEYLAT